MLLQRLVDTLSSAHHLGERCGMTKKDMQKLFKPFTKLEKNAELNPNGVGLGLYICEKILQELNGFIKVTSTTEEEAKGSNNVEGKEKGTKFKFGIRVWHHE
jgi:signal transduction histidine kinase